jgi:predicted Rossmann fold nucleotide-binding protein DprA/Smf involved in DNA uptake
MRLIIAGSRKLEPSIDFIHSAILMHGITNITEVVSGTANGVDQEGEHWASHFGAKVKQFPAKWKTISHPDAVVKENKYGKYDALAGHRRNKEMALYADALLLIWDGESSGSANMKNEMLKRNKPVFEVVLKVNYNP